MATCQRRRGPGTGSAARRTWPWPAGWPPSWSAGRACALSGGAHHTSVDPAHSCSSSTCSPGMLACSCSSGSSACAQALCREAWYRLPGGEGHVHASGQEHAPQAGPPQISARKPALLGLLLLLLQLVRCRQAGWWAPHLRLSSAAIKAASCPCRAKTYEAPGCMAGASNGPSLTAGALRRQPAFVSSALAACTLSLICMQRMRTCCQRWAKSTCCLGLGPAFGQGCARSSGYPTELQRWGGPTNSYGGWWLHSAGVQADLRCVPGQPIQDQTLLLLLPAECAAEQRCQRCHQCRPVQASQTGAFSGCAHIRGLSQRVAQPRPQLSTPSQKGGADGPVEAACGLAGALDAGVPVQAAADSQ